jgi:hypothetical protein
MARLHRQSSHPYSGRSAPAARRERRARRPARGDETGQKSAEAVVPRANEPGNTSEGLTTREGLNLIGSIDPDWTGVGVEAERPSRSSVSGAEKECCEVLRDDQEPPDADPHVRWCGSRGE